MPVRWVIHSSVVSMTSERSSLETSAPLVRFEFGAEVVPIVGKVAAEFQIHSCLMDVCGYVQIYTYYGYKL